MSLGVISPQNAEAWEEKQRKVLNRGLEPGYSGAGFYADMVPAMVAGLTRYGGISTATGSPLGTPTEESMLKTGGGPSKAESPPYGGMTY
jgi:hypothetical protein